MSDLSTVDTKLKEGAEWRGTITVTVDDSQEELAVRQLKDPEFTEVMSKISRDELQDYREAMPSDLLSEYHDLQEKEELDEDEEERLEELEAELEETDVDIFDYLSTETFDGIRLCAKYAIVPDMEDKREALTDPETARMIEQEYGTKVNEPEDVEPYLNDRIEEMVENATNFVSFEMGMKALMETAGDEGN